MYLIKGCVVVIVVYIFFFYWIKASFYWRVQVDMVVGLPRTATSKVELNKEFLLHYSVLLQQKSLSCPSLCRTDAPTWDLRGQLLKNVYKKKTTLISEVHFSQPFGVGV